MLVPAIVHKVELEKAFAKELYTDRYFYYRGYSNCGTLPEITPDDCLYQFAIVDKKDRVIGYLGYRVDPNASNVYSFGLYSFDRGNPLIGKNLFEEMERLVKRYHRIEWRMIGGNPVKKHYDKFCAKHGGNVVVLHDVCKDADGNYHDEYVYEIVKEGGNNGRDR